MIYIHSFNHRENLAAIKADLKFHGMDFDIKIFDVQATIEETMDTTRGIFDKDYDYNKYHTYDEVMELNYRTA